jgi:hypothetical protein
MNTITKPMRAAAWRLANINALLANQETVERICAAIPDIDGMMISACDEWIQISSPNREDVLSVMRALSAGRWEREVSSADSTKIDYETKIDGFRVLLFCAEPPESCSIIEETIEIPAKTITRKTIVCK